MADDASLFYRHSGRFTPLSAFAVFATGGALGVVAGAVYAIAVYFSPVAELSIILPIALGGLLGWVVMRGAFAHHMRSPVAAGVCGLLVGVVAWYTSWLAWIYALSGWQLVIVRPDHLWQVANALAIDGVWSIGSDDEPIAGIMLKIVWLLEALIIFGFVSVLPYRMIAAAAYSESDEAWAKDKEYLPPQDLIEEDERQAFCSRLRSGDLTVLEELDPAVGDEPSFTQYVLTSAEGQDSLEHFLSIHTVTTTVNKKGEAASRSQDIVRHMVIDADTRAWIKKIAHDDARIAPTVVSPPPPDADGDTSHGSD